MGDPLKLYVHKSQGLPLAKALEQCAPLLHDGIALAYSADTCLFAKIDAQGALEFPGEKTPKNKIFELRAFNKDFELRWLADPQNENYAGAAVFLSEKEDAPGNWNVATPIEAYPRQGAYLLWGKPTQKQPLPQWTQLYEHRIGILSVPAPFPGNEKRLWLTYVEYIANEDPQKEGHGNMAVIAERLTGIQGRDDLKKKGA